MAKIWFQTPRCHRELLLSPGSRYTAGNRKHDFSSMATPYTADLTGLRLLCSTRHKSELVRKVRGEEQDGNTKRSNVCTVKRTATTKQIQLEGF